MEIIKAYVRKTIRVHLFRLHSGCWYSGVFLRVCSVVCWSLWTVLCIHNCRLILQLVAHGPHSMFCARTHTHTFHIRGVVIHCVGSSLMFLVIIFALLCLDVFNVLVNALRFTFNTPRTIHIWPCLWNYMAIIATTNIESNLIVLVVFGEHNPGKFISHLILVNTFCLSLNWVFFCEVCFSVVYRFHRSQAHDITKVFTVIDKNLFVLAMWLLLCRYYN